MKASSRGGNSAAALLRRRPNVCASCRTTQFFRPYSAVAEARTIPDANHLKPTQSDPQPPVTVSHTAEYRLRSGIILTRAPLITRALKPFENAFFFYQKRLNERLVLPFHHTLFFKENTAAELDWQIKFKERGEIPAPEVGRYYAKGRNQWNDELLVGSSLSEESRIRDILLKNAEIRVTEDGEEAKPDEIVPVERPMDRITEADKAGDVRRLDRQLDRTLYLVLRTSDGVWQFPTDDMPTDLNLHEAAQKVLDASAGVNMNTWVVGRVPVAYHFAQHRYNEDTSMKQRGEKVFFLKGRIMAGQADLKGNQLGYVDFNWLTREELKEKLMPGYFSSVRNMMADR